MAFPTSLEMSIVVMNVSPQMPAASGRLNTESKAPASPSFSPPISTLNPSRATFGRARQRTRNGQVFTIILIILVIIISATAYFSWRILSARDNAVKRLIANTRNQNQEIVAVESPIDSRTSTVNHLKSRNTASPLPNSTALRPLERFEDDSELPTVVQWAPHPESQTRYSWDDETPRNVADGKISAGPWQVTARPRNTNRRSYFSNK